MVSPPPTLDAAVRTSLAPWRVKIIVVDLASGTPAELALAQGAGFVVWADDGELVLWDAGAGTGERRDIPVELDDANAAALALSIKTWMHLGAPPPPLDEGRVEGPAPEEPPLVAPAPPLPAPRFRIEAAAGTRGNLDDDGNASLRASFAAIARTGPIDLVLGVEAGPTRTGGDDVATGDLSTFVVSGHARWGVPLTRSLAIAPMAGLVVARTTFSGTDDMARTFDASATAPGLDAGGLVEWRRGRLVVAAELAATYVLVSQELQDRNMRLVTPAHIEPRGLVRVGLVLR